MKNIRARIDSIVDNISSGNWTFAVNHGGGLLRPHCDGDFLIVKIRKDYFAIGPDRKVYRNIKGTDVYVGTNINDLPLIDYHDMFCVMGLIHLMERS